MVMLFHHTCSCHIKKLSFVLKKCGSHAKNVKKWAKNAFSTDTHSLSLYMKMVAFTSHILQSTSTDHHNIEFTIRLIKVCAMPNALI